METAVKKMRLEEKAPPANPTPQRQR